MMPLPLHLFIHLAWALVAGWLVGRYFGYIRWGMIAGFIGGVLIDLDHVLEYFLVFGFHFNLGYFLQGRQFLVGNQIRIFFHAWEYLPILLLVAWLCRSKKVVMTFILALTLGIFVHLVADCWINEYPPQNYSIIYRYERHFAAPSLLNADQYQKYISDRQALGLSSQ
jgi:hypothetical protein